MPWFSEADARRLVLQASERGIAHFDTGAFYARGVAEQRLGRIMQSTQDSKDWFISTKTGTRQDRRGRYSKDFSEAGMRSDVETSLTRLGRERIDLLYLHGPTPQEVQETAPILEALQKEGKVRRFGICGETRAFASAIELANGGSPVFSVLMGVYNILTKDHAQVFTEAKRAGFTTIAIAPLAQGLYNRGFFRPSSLADVWTIARALVKNRAQVARARAPSAQVLHKTPGWAATELALAYVMAQPFVDGAIAATTREHHLAELVAASTREVPDGLLAQLAAISPGPA